MKPFFDLEHPAAIAHRGSRLLWPENTTVAFQGAFDMGFRYLETDLHATADGILVCLHDDTLDRTTGDSGQVGYRTLEQLRRVDAGFRFDAVNGFPYRARGLTIPTLEEAVQAFPEARWVLDLKTAGMEQLLADLIARLELWDRVIVGSFRDARLRTFRRLAGDRVATSTSPSEAFKVWAAARAGRVAKVAADALQVPITYRRLNVVDVKMVQAVKEAGMQIHVWTVNEPEEMHRLLNLGVDGIITDRPDVLKRVLVDRSD